MDDLDIAAQPRCPLDGVLMRDDDAGWHCPACGLVVRHDETMTRPADADDIPGIHGG
ncbi:hypothetical protein PU630_15590 [Microbacterium horticulturae]|uniref:Transcription initiation factor IIB n=1 Tax=Microbacterium horticulturae TaxID=3028316 RepID=A0ABY8BZY7_9MICO|nr:hypothetical protein [Microbacterium sp. KACC 23027]WEG08647.1 hypothetical protein PU630_15590 [Microbacterium sp. KACC 23027]